MSAMASQITYWLFAQPFVQAQIKENIKTPRHWPLWGKSPVTGESPSQRASNAESVLIWCHHAIATIYSVLKATAVSLVSDLILVSRTKIGRYKRDWCWLRTRCYTYIYIDIKDDTEKLPIECILSHLRVTLIVAIHRPPKQLQKSRISPKYRWLCSIIGSGTYLRY